MNESNLLSDGFQLMLVGMGMVFVFLSVLVFVTTMMEKLLNKPIVEVPEQNNNNSISGEEIAAISSAIHSFRNRNLKK